MLNLNYTYIHYLSCQITLLSEQFEIMQDVLTANDEQTAGDNFGAITMYTLDDGETIVFTCSDEEEAESILIEVQNFLEECDE